MKIIVLLLWLKKKNHLEHVNTVAALAVTADEELLITGCSGHLIKVPRYISTETRHVETHEDKLNLPNRNRRTLNCEIEIEGRFQITY